MAKVRVVVCLAGRHHAGDTVMETVRAGVGLIRVTIVPKHRLETIWATAKDKSVMLPNQYLLD